MNSIQAIGGWTLYGLLLALSLLGMWVSGRALWRFTGWLIPADSGLTTALICSRAIR